MVHKKDLLSSFCMLVVGLLLAFQSLRLSIWSQSGPEAGFFPLVVAVIIIGLSLYIIIKSLILIRSKNKEKVLEAQEKKVVSVFKVSFYAILMLFYGIALEKVGFLITSTLFLILILKYVERQGWKITILVGSASIIVSYILFMYFLGVPLPRGLIKWF